MSTTIHHPRFHRMDQLTRKQLAALDKNQTVTLLPVGMIEIHGDHLPLGTDNFSVEALTLSVAAWLLDTQPDLHVMLLPTLNYGTAPVDERRPDLFADGGSLWISRGTLKAIIRELSDHLITYGFRAIFPLSWHGGPDQSRALREICAEFRAHHDALVMYEPMGYVLAGAELQAQPGLATLLGRPLTTQEEVALQSSIHASMFETSVMLHLIPELVSPRYRELRTIEWQQMYQMTNWPGYVGAAPAHANPDIGAAMMRWRGIRAGHLIARALNGEELDELPRHPRWDDDEEIAAALTEIPEFSDHPLTPHDESKPVMSFDREQIKHQIDQATHSELPAKPERADPNDTPWANKTQPGRSHYHDQDSKTESS